MEWPSAKETLTVKNERGHDVQSLPTAHVLFTIWREAHGGGIGMRITMWCGRTPVKLDHPLAAQRLATGHAYGDAKFGQG